MRVRSDGAWRDVIGGRAYIGGAWRELNEAKAYIDGEFKVIAEFVDDLSVSVLNDDIFAERFGSGLALSPPVLAAPNGGRGPYTYQWSRVSGAFASISSPNTAETRFSFFVQTFESVVGVYRCTVTDSLGSTASVDVRVTFVSDFFDGFQ